MKIRTLLICVASISIIPVHSYCEEDPHKEIYGIKKEPFSLLRKPVYMRVIEVAEKTLPQIKTVFQGLRGIV